MTHHLIGGIGVASSLSAAIALNLLVGITCVSLGSRQTHQKDRLEPHTPTRALVSDAPTARPVIVQALALASGFAFITLEVTLARLFSIVLLGSLYALAAILIVFLLGTALGSFCVATRRSLNNSPVLGFACSQSLCVVGIWLISLLLPAMGSLLREIGSLESVRGFTAQHVQLTLIFLFLGPPTMSAGASFSFLVLLCGREHESNAIAAVYAANTLGCILGALVAGFILIPQLGTSHAMNATLVIIAATAVSAAIFIHSNRRVTTLAVALLGVALAVFYRGIDTPRILGLRGQDDANTLVYFAEGTESTVAVQEQQMSRTLSINGLGQGARSLFVGRKNIESLIVGLAPMLHVPKAERALVVGLGAGTTVELMAQSHLREIDVVEIEQKVVDALSYIYPEGGPLRSEKVSLLLEDARAYLMRNTRDQPYDVIASMAAHPWVSPSLYTQEFFDLVSNNLSPHGVFATWFGSHGISHAAVKSLFRAFCAVFNNYIIYYVPEVSAYYLVGSRSPLSIKSDSLHATATLVEENAILNNPYFLPARVYASGYESTFRLPPGPVNTDDTAFLEAHAPLNRTSLPPPAKFFSKEYLDPQMISEGDRRSVVVATLEHLLASPLARLRDTPVISERYLNFGAAVARRTLTAALNTLSDKEARYFAGRIALAEGRSEEARELLEMAAGDDDIGRRAAVFVAVTYPVWSTERRDALASLYPSLDVVIEALDIDVQFGLGIARRLDAGLSPLADFLRQAALGSEPTLDELNMFDAVVSECLLRTSRIGVLTVAETFARHNGLHRTADAIDHKKHLSRALKAEYLTALGNKATLEKQFQEASRLYLMAYDLDPANKQLLHNILTIIPSLSHDPYLTELTEQLRLFGIDMKF